MTSRTIETPQSFIIKQECQKAAFDNGFRREMGIEGGWAHFQSTTASGNAWLAGSSDHGPWYLALDHNGVVTELGKEPVDMPGPGLARFAFDRLGPLYAAMERVYQLAVSLPDVPLDEFRKRTGKLPQTTETERLTVQRIGQDIFRSSLMDYWQGRCPLTGITEPELLRASHIVPWKNCESDAERLNVYNGLLLSALWDAAFDKGLVSFSDDGRPLFSVVLGKATREELHWNAPLSLAAQHRQQLTWHRNNKFQA